MMISEQELSRRQRLGKIIAVVCAAWWVASIGGIIYVIQANQ